MIKFKTGNLVKLTARITDLQESKTMPTVFYGVVTKICKLSGQITLFWFHADISLVYDKDIDIFTIISE